jgi:transcriptional regulator with XRE-family HTH domain
MVRVPLTEAERRRGRRLGELLRQARAQRSMAEVAAAAGLSAETLRKIETGRIATPALFTVAALADVLDLSLDAVVSAAVCDSEQNSAAGFPAPG